MKIDTFGKHFCRNDDVEIVFPFSLIVGVKILPQHWHHFIAIGTLNGQQTSVAFFFQSIRKIFCRFFAFGKNQKFTLIVDILVKQPVFQII